MLRRAFGLEPLHTYSRSLAATDAQARKRKVIAVSQPAAASRQTTFPFTKKQKVHFTLIP